MKCIHLEELISLYIDNMLDEHTKKLVESHLDECDECRHNYETIVSNIKICEALPEIPLPEDYNATLREKLIATQNESNAVSLNKEKFKKNKSKKKYNWKLYGSIAAVFIVFFITFTALSTSDFSRTEQSAPSEMAAEERGYDIKAESPKAAPEARMFTAGDSNSSINQSFDNASLEIDNQMVQKSMAGRKVISNAFINIDIENYDEKFDKIVSIINSTGGYIEHSDTQYKYYVPEKLEESLKIGNITARVPKDIFLATIDEIKAMGTVTNFGSSGQDITMQYRDTVNEMENLKVQEERLREIMAKANDVKDILEIERELTRVRGEINRMSGDIERWDDLVELSTINISLNEIHPKDRKIQSVSDNLWDKAGKGFIRTINSLMEAGEAIIIGFISFAPILIILIIAITILVVIIKRFRKRQ